MRFEISQKLPRRSTIVIHHRDIFLISESDICRDFPSGSTRLLIEFSIVRLRAIRDSFLRWIIFLPIHKTSTIDSFLFVVLRVRFSILQRISIDLLRFLVITKNEAIQETSKEFLLIAGLLHTPRVLPMLRKGAQLAMNKHYL